MQKSFVTQIYLKKIHKSWSKNKNVVSIGRLMVRN